MIQKQCPQCGTEFKARQHATKFCSRACKYASQSVPRIKREPKTCPRCLNDFIPERESNKFCSLKCAVIPEFSEFISKVQFGDGCWIWNGMRNTLGYGAFMTRDRKRRLAHRMMFQFMFGEIPNGLNLCHKCDNPPCVNPNHMFPGTQADNMADAVSKNRMPRGEKSRVSKLLETQVIEIRKRYSSGESGTILAKEFGIHRQYLYRIAGNKAWSHVVLLN